MGRRRLSEEEIQRRAFLRGRSDSQARIYNRKLYNEWYPAIWKIFSVWTLFLLMQIHSCKANNIERIKTFESHRVDYETLYRTEESLEASAKKYKGYQLKESCLQ